MQRLGWRRIMEGLEGHAKEFVVQMHWSRVGGDAQPQEGGLRVSRRGCNWKEPL